MPVPSNRTPVRLARGDYSALSTNLSSLGEGELVFAKDEDRLYMVESGVLVACTTDVSTKADLVNGKLDPAQLPSLAISEYMGEAADEAAMIAFVGERGDWCVRTDLGTTFILSTDDPTVAANWIQISTPAPVFPVDSVNGETGAVSLGVQDMDDFALNLTSPEYTGLTNKVLVSSQIQSTSDWTYASYFDRTEFYYLDDLATDLNVLSSGDSVTFKAPGVSDVTATLTANPTRHTFDLYRLDFPAGIFPQEWDDLPLGTAVILESTPFGGASIPLADEDVLKWSSADQEFKPAQLATVATSGSYNDLADQPTIPAAAPVDSVNGETGAVSLGIQDMDDYGLRPDYSSVYSFNYANHDPSNTSWVGADGEWGDTTDSGFTRLTFSGVDANGVTVPHPTGNAAWWYSTDNGSSWTSKSSQTWVSLGSAFTVQENSSITRSGNLQITWTDPNSPATLPVADGDVLQYVAADSEFKPTALATVATSGDYDDLTNKPTIPAAAPVDSVNGETGAVSLGIQEMDDFAPFSTPPGGEATWDYQSGSGIPATGAYTIINTQQLRLENNGASSVMPYTSGDPIWIAFASANDGAFAEYEVSSFVYTTPYWTLTLTSAIPGTGNLGELTTSQTDPGVSIPVALVDGEILRWNNIDQKFKPATLATVATSGDYDDLTNKLTGSDVRTLLGIGEYVDDAAAGTGGVASGAMYYNTTSSDYRLKS